MAKKLNPLLIWAKETAKMFPDDSAMACVSCGDSYNVKVLQAIVDDAGFTEFGKVTDADGGICWFCMNDND